MIFLQDNDDYQRIGVLDDLKSRTIRAYGREILGSSGKTQGIFARLGAVCLAVFRWQGELYLFLNENAYSWRDVQSVSLTRHGEGSELLSVKVGGCLLQIEYPSIHVNPPLSDVFEPFVEEEDYDFGLFIRNLFNDPKRWKIAFAESSG